MIRLGDSFDRDIKHDLLMHIAAGWLGTDVEGCPRCDLVRRPSQENPLFNHTPRTLAACQPCTEDKHDHCTPLLTQGNLSTVCGCFAAHPDADEHTEALFWLGEYGTQAQEDHHHYGSDAT